jgi:hypothetical protein
LAQNGIVENDTKKMSNLFEISVHNIIQKVQSYGIHTKDVIESDNKWTSKALNKKDTTNHTQLKIKRGQMEITK